MKLSRDNAGNGPPKPAHIPAPAFSNHMQQRANIKLGQLPSTGKAGIMDQGRKSRGR